MVTHEVYKQVETRSSNMRQDVDETLVFSRLELLRRVSIHRDLDAWASFQQSLEETVLSWLYVHPGKEVACRVQSERHFVALAFERMRQAVVQGKVACETLSEVLVYLHVSLNGAILETLRVSERTRAVSSLLPDGEDCPGGSEAWDRLQALLSNECERRLAYLLYQCGLQPAEIVRYRPLEWGDVHEVIRLRRIILARLTQRPGSP
jgi:hypothetical protein